MDTNDELLGDTDDELLGEFINESREHLTSIEADLLAIEEGGANIDAELVNKVFRAAHSIKGASSFFGLAKVKELAHKAETVLDMMRSKKMIPNAEITNLLLAAFDRLREMIEHPAESAEADIGELVVNLTGLASSYLPQEQKASLIQTVSLKPEGGGSPVVLSRFDYERSRDSGHYLYCVEYDLIHDIERHGRNVLEVFRTLSAAGEILDCEVNFEAVGTLDDSIGKQLPLRLILSAVSNPADIGSLFPHNRDKVKLLCEPDLQIPSIIAEPTVAPSVAAISPTLPKRDLPEICPTVAPTATAGHTTQTGAVSAVVVEDSIRVNVGVLEALVNLAGELVLGRNQLRASIARKDSLALEAAGQRINQITSELQDVVMQTRLQPIGNVFAKFPRLVRDLSGALGKEIELDIRGKDVALDRSLLEALSDPLIHMVRNAVDHGVELPEDRIRAGKKRQGTVIIDAHHEAGQVVVEIADDGQGIDAERIAETAEAKGLIAHAQLQNMSAQDKTSLIFRPGLSTATKLTDISGRGVGMDVVKTNLDRLGGKVEIVSVMGKGTTFRIKLPLTLAIISSLIVSVEGERFAIPQINVEELLRVQPGKTKARIEIVGETEVLVLRDRLIPLVRFANLAGILPTYIDSQTDSSSREIDRRENLVGRPSQHHSDIVGEGAEKENAKLKDKSAAFLSRRGAEERLQNAGATLEIAVLTTGTQTYGLVVGAFHDTEEIVVKPLGSHLKGLQEYAGATILGDGTVALILDVAGLATKAELGVVSGTAHAREQIQADGQERLADTHSLLLFHNGPDQLCAVPLDTVLRIERIRPEQVETIGGRRTMQHHGGFLSLVALSDTAQVNPFGDVKELAVMISNVRGHEVGLLGAMPVDVIESKAKIDQVTHRQKGVAGSAIIRHRTALVVDLFELVDATWPEWAAQCASEKPRAFEAEDRVVLLAEDSDFFRAQLTRYLEEDGYTVLAAPDGEAAWDLLGENVERIKIVVTDIEMPRLDGLGLTRRIRADARTAGLPIMAITCLASDEDFARGKAVGINEYQTKLDRDNLLAGLQRLMAAYTTSHAQLNLAVPV